MSMLDTLRKKLSPEQLTSLTDALGDDFDFDLVPRSRLNKVIGQRNTLRDTLEELSQAGGEDEGEDDFEDDTGKGAKGTKTGTDGKKQKAPRGLTQQDIDDAVAKAKAEKDDEVVNLRKRYAATEKLRAANIVDPDLVLNSGLLDLTKLTFKEDGTLDNIDTLIKGVTDSKPFLVGTGTGGGHTQGTGKTGGTEQFASVTSKAEFLKLDTAKQIQFKNDQPELFKQFLSE